MLDFYLAENLALRDYRDGARGSACSQPRRMLDARQAAAAASSTSAAASPARRARSLSGGNQQKVVIAREISGNPEALVAAQPTRGLDVGAIEFVHRRLLAERDAGRAILLVSLELEEVRALADRILVIYDGRIVGELPPDRVRRGARAAHDRLGGRSGARPHERPSPPDAPRAGVDPAPAAGATVAARLSGHLRRGRHRHADPHDAAGVLRRRPRGAASRATTRSAPTRRSSTGTGLKWLFPWTTGADRAIAAINLQQTLLLTAPLILLGLAVAYAFRAGLFNIGGQGQYIVGSIVAVWVGSSFAGMPHLLHVVLAVVLAALARRAPGPGSPAPCARRRAPTR